MGVESRSWRKNRSVTSLVQHGLQTFSAKTSWNSAWWNSSCWSFDWWPWRCFFLKARWNTDTLFKLWRDCWRSAIRVRSTRVREIFVWFRRWTSLHPSVTRNWCAHSQTSVCHRNFQWSSSCTWYDRRAFASLSSRTRWIFWCRDCASRSRRSANWNRLRVRGLPSCDCWHQFFQIVCLGQAQLGSWRTFVQYRRHYRISLAISNS